MTVAEALARLKVSAPAPVAMSHAARRTTIATPACLFVRLRTARRGSQTTPCRNRETLRRRKFQRFERGQVGLIIGEAGIDK